MANHVDTLDRLFVALADPTRRQVIRRLGHGPASVSELAQPFSITLPSFMKHVGVLETTGLITTTKSGRVRTCELNRTRLDLVGGWLAEQHEIWEARTDRLEHVVTQEETP